MIFAMVVTISPPCATTMLVAAQCLSFFTTLVLLVFLSSVVSLGVLPPLVEETALFDGVRAVVTDCDDPLHQSLLGDTLSVDDLAEVRTRLAEMLAPLFSRFYSCGSYRPERSDDDSESQPLHLFSRLLLASCRHIHSVSFLKSQLCAPSP